MGAHDDEAGVLLGGGLDQFLGGVSHLPAGFVIDLVLEEELGHRGEDFFGFFLLVRRNCLAAHHGLHTRGHGGLDVQDQQFRLGPQQGFMDDQIGQGFLGVFTSINGEQDFHGVSYQG